MPKGVYEHKKQKGKIGFWKNKIKEESPSWKGNKVKYRGLHMWIQRHFGKPNICECCGKISDKYREMQWANIDHCYTRDRDDWIRLCVTCHIRYDLIFR